MAHVYFITAMIFLRIKSSTSSLYAVSYVFKSVFIKCYNLIDLQRIIKNTTVVPETTFDLIMSV